MPKQNVPNGQGVQEDVPEPPDEYEPEGQYPVNAVRPTPTQNLPDSQT